ncbi:MAG: DNA polymerase III subunit alpha, partial [Candidatus Aminicenantes bacterium]|nr:DNA polymerase III subunit alpha [Candidatus Aminicenantes bacterium]
DFDPERREDVIEYIRNKYGEENVAQIVTFGKMKAKMAIRDTGRVLEVPLGDVDKLAKLIPETPNVSLREEVENNEELQKEIKRMEAAPRLIDYALKLENNIRNTGMHAAGVVIAPKKLIEFMPLYKAKDKIVTQFEKEEVEQIGLLKLDILGLKTLTIIKNILSSIKEIEKKDLDLQTIPLDDKKTFKLFQDGYTDGIFQFESSGMRDYLKRSRPQKFEDLVVLNGLYRPGPLGTGMADTYVNRKIGKEKVSYIFNETEEILKDTYGVIVFQEQVMRISQIIAGFPMSKADEMRKIMGKKQVQKLPAVKKDFMEGAAKRGFNKKKAEELFLQMSTFAQYGFNKSHSTAYANLAYQTAYLKVHFPVYFMSSLLTTESDKSSTDSKIIQYISECRKMGIEILPPDINRSFEKFRVESAGSIRYGLKGLKNVGDKAIKSFLEVRISDGEFTNYSDFITRSNMSKTNKAVIESLIKAGAFDVFGLKRRTLFESLE